MLFQSATAEINHIAHLPVRPLAVTLLSVCCDVKHVSQPRHLGVLTFLTWTMTMTSCHLFLFPFVVITTNLVSYSSGGQMSSWVSRG